MLELARSEFIERKENVLALGNSGTGKTHNALALGLAACQKGLPLRKRSGHDRRRRRLQLCVGALDDPTGLQPSHHRNVRTGDMGNRMYLRHR